MKDANNLASEVCFFNCGKMYNMKFVILTIFKRMIECSQKSTLDLGVVSSSPTGVEISKQIKCTVQWH